jgi:hypothetical protein
MLVDGSGSSHVRNIPGGLEVKFPLVGILKDLRESGLEP